MKKANAKDEILHCVQNDRIRMRLPQSLCSFAMTSFEGLRMNGLWIPDKDFQE